MKSVTVILLALSVLILWSAALVAGYRRYQSWLQSLDDRFAGPDA